MSVQRTVMSRYTQLQMASGPGIYDNYKLQVNSYGETSVFNRDCGQLVPKPAAASKTNWLDGSADSASKPKKQVPHQQTTAASVPALPQGVFRGNGGHLPPASVPVAAVAAIP